MKLLYCRSRNPLSWLIRLITWSDWSHIVILAPDGSSAVEAAWGGVKATTLLKAILSNDIVQCVEHPCSDPDQSWLWAMAQVGQPYSYLGLMGMLVHQDWRRAGTWECSSLATEALAQGGSPPFREEVLAEITPQHLWMLPNPLVKLG